MPVALLAEGVDRNFFASETGEEIVMSPSSRRAWIEIGSRVELGKVHNVALLAEGVDRNLWAAAAANKLVVALLAEGVDRNGYAQLPQPVPQVALLAEGVDRNSFVW